MTRGLKGGAEASPFRGLVIVFGNPHWDIPGVVFPLHFDKKRSKLPAVEVKGER